MIWQDIVFTLGGFAFGIALLPALRAAEKPPLLTSTLTAGILYLYSATMVSLDLRAGAVATVVTALMWTGLAIQKLRHSAGLED